MNKTKHIITKIAAVAVVLLMLVSCAAQPKLADGEYVKASAPDSHGGWAEVKITVSGGKITDCQFLMFESGGILKDENYGSSLPAELFDKAQTALKGSQEYPKQLLARGNANDIAAVTGATESMKVFKELATQIIDEATEK